MSRFLVSLFGLIFLLASQAQAGPSAGAVTLADAVNNAFASQTPIIKVQTGGSGGVEVGKGGSTPGTNAGAIRDRSKHRVVIFTDDRSRVVPLLKALKSRGYEKGSYIADKPNRKWNIKWGAANKRHIDEILGVVKSKLDISPSRIERQKKFKPDDTDIFINLRFSKSSSASTASTSGLSKHRVVIFTNDKGQVTSLLNAIKSRGFHKDSYITAEPNDDWNIKWGAASSKTIDEVLAVIDAEMGIPANRLRKSREFDATDSDIFVNLKF